MLFVFEKKFIPVFWMKDMNFDLDFIWIRDNTIVDITERVPAPQPNITDTELLRYSPTSNVDQVLEVNSGWIQSHNIKVGDKIKL